MILKKYIFITALVVTFILSHISSAALGPHDPRPGESFLITEDVIEVTLDGDIELQRALNNTVWTIISDSDTNYSVARHPLSVDRFTSTLDADDHDNNGQSEEDVVLRHKFYLSLPYPLQLDKSYTVKVNSVPISFIWRVTAGQGRSGAARAIKINQHGYNSAAKRRYAYVGYWMGSKGPLLINSSLTYYIYRMPGGELIYKSDTEDRGYDKVSGEHVHQIELSSLSPGKYYIEVDGIGRSYPFVIGGSDFEAFHTVFRGLYHQRCGTGLSEENTLWSRKACHEYVYEANTVENWGAFFPPDTSTELPLVRLPAGWHDAGDFDRRPLHMLTVEYLLLLTELFPQKLGDNLNIPESNDGLPDTLNEAMYGLRLWSFLQEGDGGIRSGVESYRHPLPTTAAEDPLPYWTYNRNRYSSYQFAAVGSHALRVMKDYENIFSSQERDYYKDLMKMAQLAWEWAERNDSEIGTTATDGGHERSTLERTKMWAAGELYHACYKIPEMNCDRDFRTELIKTIYNDGIKKEVLCANSIDDDLDGFTDCMDPDCSFQSSCGIREEDCSDNIDNNDNGLTDCRDPDCVFDINGNERSECRSNHIYLGLMRKYLSPLDHSTIHTIWSLVAMDRNLVMNETEVRLLDIIKNLSVAKIFQSADDYVSRTFDPLNRYRNALSPGTADEYLENTEEKPGYPLDWGGGTTTVKYMVPVILAYSLSPNQIYIDTVSVNADYQLGAHPLAQSWITGLGYHDPIDPLHLDSIHDKIAEPVPGLPINGPFPNSYSSCSNDYWKCLVYNFFYPPATNHFSLSPTPFMHHYSVWSGMSPMNEFNVWLDMNATIFAHAFLYAVSGDSDDYTLPDKTSDYPLNPGYFVTGTGADIDGDGYLGSSNDCNDINPVINPGAFEVCGDRVDNDCNGEIDCDDISCKDLLICKSAIENCIDGIDNDGDDAVDCKDDDCDSFWGCNKDQIVDGDIRDTDDSDQDAAEDVASEPSSLAGCTLIRH